MDDQAKQRDRELARQVGACLAARRKALRLTQDQLAERLGIEKESVSRIETGFVSPSLGRLSTLAEALDLSLLDLLRDVSDRPKDQAAALTAAITDLPPRKRALVMRTATELAAILRDDAV
ncbi:TPA: helix-turn-helix transcriptional regulator [Burkholderia vietnamiensis]|nr:helix-turn-helix transcriptional regulator [Burkholderia vietnamiensis]